MKSILNFLTLFVLLLTGTFCNPLDLRNPEDTRSRAGLEKILWQEFIRPKSVCDPTEFEYSPNYTSFTVKEALTPMQFLQTNDRSIYLFGIATFNPEKNLGTFSGTEDTPSGRNAVLFKFSERGVLQWSRSLGRATSAGNALGIMASDSGVYLTVTTIESVGTPLRSFTGTNGNIAVFHIGSDGKIIWNTYFGETSNNNKSYSIAKLSNGDLIISGESNSNGIPSFPGTKLSLYSSIPTISNLVMRLKPSGDAVWIHLFGGPSSGINFQRSGTRVAVSSNNTISVYGFETEPFFSGYANVVQNHTGTTPRKNYAITQFDENGTYLRHTFLSSSIALSDPILPLPIESNTPNEMLFAGITNSEFAGMDSVRARNYQGSADQFLIKLNASLVPSFVTYLGGPNVDPGSIYRIYQDARRDGYFIYSPYLFDPGFGSGFPNNTGRATPGLVRMDLNGRVQEFGFKGETDFSVPFTMLNTCDGGILAGYYTGSAIDSSTSTFAKFRMTKVRPYIPVWKEYATGYGPVIGQ
jgi:hypothetical protein